MNESNTGSSSDTSSAVEVAPSETDTPEARVPASKAERSTRLSDLRAKVSALREDALNAEKQCAEQIEAVAPRHRNGAVNMVHYGAVRSHDLRELQPALAAEGLSSLGRMESGVLGNLEAVIRIIDDALDQSGKSVDERTITVAGARVEAQQGGDILARNAADLLGGEPTDRSTRIMVTMPSNAATDPDLITHFATAGMDDARINCAHDDPGTWRAIAAHIRSTSSSLRIAMDLGGPKLRTGPIAEGPRVIKVRPSRNALGTVLTPARCWFGEAPSHSEITTAVPVDDVEWVAARRVGDSLSLYDARGRHRHLEVLAIGSSGVLVGCDRTMYLVPGTVVSAHRGTTAILGEVAPVAQAHRIFRGDTVTLTADMTPSGPSDGSTHRIGCSLPEAFGAVRAGDRVLFDDGKIEGVATAASDTEISVNITRAAPTGTKLKAQKGINLPDTSLPVDAVTAQDVQDLDTVVDIADFVELSFVRTPADVAKLQKLLAERNAADLGVVLKIETAAGFANLLWIMLQLMQTDNVGIMIARGDLAVEVGFESLAEVQEEILWLCEAAHIPVIWATEVLDSLADHGIPTRAEVTDAAAGERAECVMLNKGPYIVDAIEALSEILARMKGHIDKKRPILNRLGTWDPHH